MDTRSLANNIQLAAKAIQNANFIYLTSGAGMGVDSGLPDFRGPEGFWKAYPPMKHLGLKFENMSNPMWFDKDPKFAWGFFKHRFDLYTSSKPHEGYHILKRIADTVVKQYKGDYFVFTSNVDGHWEQLFPKDKIEECHGAIRYLQCTSGSSECGIWPVTDIDSFRNRMTVDTKTFKIKGDDEDILPKCPKCGKLARPNILMFSDCSWNPERNDQQVENKLKTIKNYLKSCNKEDQSKKSVAIIEIGAGNCVSTVRNESEWASKKFPNSTLIRINLRDFEGPESFALNNENPSYIPIAMGGKEALKKIEEELEKNGYFA